MLNVENISTGYGKKQVLFDISFQIGKGEMVLIAGSNGSGKSTLLKAIYGLLPIWNNGTIIFNEEDITGKPTSTILKKGLLYIPQKNNLFEDLTVKENLEMGGLTIGDRKVLQQRIENTLSIFPSLVPHLQRTPMKLSGGERHLLTLAIATLYQPQMILCDEPFAGLSGKNLTFVVENFQYLNQQNGVTILIVEHRVKEYLAIANKVIGFKLGKIFKEIRISKTFSITEFYSTFI